MLAPSLVPLLRVSNVPRSIAFYESLGFSVRSVEGEPEPYWANVCASGETAAAELMLSRDVRSSEPEGIVLYYSVKQVRALRDTLVQMGLNPSEITHPTYAPSGEFTVADPDGHVLMIGQPADC